MRRLHEFSTRLLAINNFQAMPGEVLGATIALQNANFEDIVPKTSLTIKSHLQPPHPPRILSVSDLIAPAVISQPALA